MTVNMKKLDKVLMKAKKEKKVTINQRLSFEAALLLSFKGFNVRILNDNTHIEYTGVDFLKGTVNI